MNQHEGSLKAVGHRIVKTLTGALVATALFPLIDPTPARAATFEKVARVQRIRLHDSSSFTSSTSNWISLEGITSLGACAVWQGWEVPLLVRDGERGRQMVAVATAAKLSGRTVRVYVNDTLRNTTGYCILQWIDLE
jgi:hypothetical protein